MNTSPPTQPGHRAPQRKKHITRRNNPDNKISHKLLCSLHLALHPAKIDSLNNRLALLHPHLPPNPEETQQTTQPTSITLTTPVTLENNPQGTDTSGNGIVIYSLTQENLAILNQQNPT
tara:strand:+ start:703 stop:1059 length:357 start_codon:yes stop_codon:yes gene_type:complete